MDSNPNHLAVRFSYLSTVKYLLISTQRRLSNLSRVFTPGLRGKSLNPLVGPAHRAPRLCGATRWLDDDLKVVVSLQQLSALFHQHGLPKGATLEG